MTSNDEKQNAAENPQQDPQAGQGLDANTPRYVAFQKVNVAIKSGYILRKVGQAHMVMPTGPRMKEYEGMITLNETGAFLFQEAQKEDPTREKFEQACIEKYGATPEEASQAAKAFILQCANCGLMETEIKYIDTQTGQEVTKEQMAEDSENEPAK